ncbi:MAG: hypothetical protein LLG04_01835 [Parachlamydia sp.]|nr:hypothetical protein [Parachlamydia sp.]
MEISHVCHHSQHTLDSKNREVRLLTQKSNWQGHTVCRAAAQNPLITLPLIGICLGIAGVSLVAGITFRAALLGAAVAVALPVALIILLSIIRGATK